MVGQSLLVPECEKRRTAKFHFSRSTVFVLLFRQASSNQSITQRRRSGFRFSFCSQASRIVFLSSSACQSCPRKERDRERKGVASFLLHIFSCLARKCTERKETKTHSIFILPARILCVCMFAFRLCAWRRNQQAEAKNDDERREEKRARAQAKAIECLCGCLTMRMTRARRGKNQIRNDSYPSRERKAKQMGMNLKKQSHAKHPLMIVFN